MSRIAVIIDTYKPVEQCADHDRPGSREDSGEAGHVVRRVIMIHGHVSLFATIRVTPSESRPDSRARRAGPESETWTSWTPDSDLRVGRESRKSRRGGGAQTLQPECDEEERERKGMRVH